MSIFSPRSRISFKAAARGTSKFLHPRRGFTLIELLVVIAIITIITAVTLFSQSQFDSSTLLRSLSYSVALSLSQAQTYGTSVRYSTSTPSNEFSESYGVYFDSSDLSLTPPQYFIFQDYNNNGAYDPGEGLPAFVVPRGYVVSRVCGVISSTNEGTNEDCYPSVPTGVTGLTGTALTYLTIYFRRPNPDACFESSNHPSDCALGSSEQDYSAAFIQMKPAGTATCKADGGTQDCRAVKITTTGQITVCTLNAQPGATTSC